MRRLSSKKVREQAARLDAIIKKLELLESRKKALEAEAAELKAALYKTSTGESFQFNNNSGYLMQLNFIPCSRKILDQTKVHKIFNKLGVKVPLKTSRWIQTTIDYVPSES